MISEFLKSKNTTWKDLNCPKRGSELTAAISEQFQVTTTQPANIAQGARFAAVDAVGSMRNSAEIMVNRATNAKSTRRGTILCNGSVADLQADEFKQLTEREKRSSSGAEVERLRTRRATIIAQTIQNTEIREENGDLRKMSMLDFKDFLNEEDELDLEQQGTRDRSTSSALRNEGVADRQDMRTVVGDLQKQYDIQDTRELIKLIITARREVSKKNNHCMKGFGLIVLLLLILLISDKL